MEIDRDAGRAPYQQLADIIRTQIATGEIEVGRRIPSITELEQQYDVSRNTIKRAIIVLKDEGLLRTVPGMGLYVTKLPDSEEPAGE